MVMSDEELAKLAALTALRQRVLPEDALYSNIIGQMKGNLERMERENTANMPPLDSKSPANAGKTQCLITREIKELYEGKRKELRSQYPEAFKED